MNTEGRNYEYILLYRLNGGNVGGYGAGSPVSKA